VVVAVDSAVAEAAETLEDLAAVAAEEEDGEEEDSEVD